MANKHAIIIVKNTRGEYLQYYENSWNGYLFLNCKCENNKDIAKISDTVLEKLGINYLINIGLDYLGRIPYKASEILEEVQNLYKNYKN